MTERNRLLNQELIPEQNPWPILPPPSLQNPQTPILPMLHTNKDSGVYRQWQTFVKLSHWANVSLKPIALQFILQLLSTGDQSFQSLRHWPSPVRRLIKEETFQRVAFLPEESTPSTAVAVSHWDVIATPSIPAEIFPDSMYSHLLMFIHTIVARTEISVAMYPEDIVGGRFLCRWVCV